MQRVLNFGAGPAMLPLAVIERIAREWGDFEHTGRAIVELYHRDLVYRTVHERCLSRLREALELPADWEIALMPGGATLQFSLIPLNLLPVSTSAPKSADYVLTDHWSMRALEEALPLVQTRVAASSAVEGTFKGGRLPRKLVLDPRARFVHFTSNNTTSGTQWAEFPPTNDVPLVIDATSDLLTRRLPYERCDVIYAGTQKNLGIAGLAVVLIRRSALAGMRADLPSMWRYAQHIDHGSMFNTPPMFQVYVTLAVVEWVLEQGGLNEMIRRAEQRSREVYAVLDRYPQLYLGHAAKEDASKVTLTWHLPSMEIEAKFLREAEAEGLVQLRGHRTIGGVRAAMFNAMPVAGATRLAQFMERFAQRSSTLLRSSTAIPKASPPA